MSDDAMIQYLVKMGGVRLLLPLHPLHPYASSLPIIASPEGPAPVHSAPLPHPFLPPTLPPSLPLRSPPRWPLAGSS
jgi:hypothetical protein